eukprot:m.184849 g.184849  ORF g.184849 m.184849 type:complete len:66 (+) comp14721_c1_seq3:1824-2021(+)
MHWTHITFSIMHNTLHYITTHKLERPFGTELRISRTAVAAEVLACRCSNAARALSTPRKAVLVLK